MVFEYLERFLEGYEEFLSEEDFCTLLLLLGLLPRSFVYDFVLSLRRLDCFLCRGDVRSGRASVGCIVLREDCVVLVDGGGVDHVLLCLPPAWEVG